MAWKCTNIVTAIVVLGRSDEQIEFLRTGDTSLILGGGDDGGDDDDDVIEEIKEVCSGLSCVFACF